GTEHVAGYTGRGLEAGREGFHGRDRGLCRHRRQISSGQGGVMQRNLLVAVAFVAAIATSPSSAQVLKLGFMAPMSGPSASAGQEMKRGLDAALEKFNNRIGGLETRVSIADDKGLPDTGAQE